jgi:hypothetical protein
MGALTGRATNLNGAFQQVRLGATSKILGAGKYSISGETRKTLDASEFGVDVDIFEFGSADGGTITLSEVNYDPTDPEQNTLRTAVQNGTKLIHSVTSGIRFYINSTSYLTVATSGHLLMTSGGKVEADRNGFAKTSFEGKISGGFMWVCALTAIP